MGDNKLKELYEKMLLVHNKSQGLFDLGTVPSMLKNEFNNKVSQYDNMYDSIETMKAMTDNQETIDNLINQQIEVLTVRIKWELDWATRAAVRTG